MKRHQWYVVECEKLYPWNMSKNKWVRLAEPTRWKKDAIKIAKYAKQTWGGKVRNIKIWKMIPIEEVEW